MARRAVRLVVAVALAGCGRHGSTSFTLSVPQAIADARSRLAGLAATVTIAAVQSSVATGAPQDFAVDLSKSPPSASASLTNGAYTAHYTYAAQVAGEPVKLLQSPEISFSIFEPGKTVSLETDSFTGFDDDGDGVPNLDEILQGTDPEAPPPNPVKWHVATGDVEFVRVLGDGSLFVAARGGSTGALVFRYGADGTQAWRQDAASDHVLLDEARQRAVVLAGSVGSVTAHDLSSGSVTASPTLSIGPVDMPAMDSLGQLWLIPNVAVTYPPHPLYRVSADLATVTQTAYQSGDQELIGRWTALADRLVYHLGDGILDLSQEPPVRVWQTTLSGAAGVDVASLLPASSGVLYLSDGATVVALDSAYHALWSTQISTQAASGGIALTSWGDVVVSTLTTGGGLVTDLRSDGAIRWQKSGNLIGEASQGRIAAMGNGPVLIAQDGTVKAVPYVGPAQNDFSGALGRSPGAASGDMLYVYGTCTICNGNELIAISLQ